MCDQRKQYDQCVSYVPLSVLEHYAPHICHLIEPDILLNRYRLFIRLPLHDHVEDIEWAGLYRLLAHWNHAAANMIDTPLPPTNSVSDAIKIYRSLQLMLKPEAETLRSRIMHTLHTTPLTELDVQTIWWAFQAKPEWPSWLDALCYNLVRFQVLSGQPCGTAIQLFIETEMLNMDNAQYCQVLVAYERHGLATRSRVRTTVSRCVERSFCRFQARS